MINVDEFIQYREQNNVKLNVESLSFAFHRFSIQTTIEKNAREANERLKPDSSLEELQSFSKEKLEENAHIWRDFKICFEFLADFRSGKGEGTTQFREATIGIDNIANLETVDLKKEIIKDIIKTFVK